MHSIVYRLDNKPPSRSIAVLPNWLIEFRTRQESNCKGMRVRKDSLQARTEAESTTWNPYACWPLL
jgi:hypothetical protein